ncbi:hemolysin type calcium-binding protein [Shimia abyssi]|uniref:Hemolysin type calcium-binding protein n=1 Tax=Shimia abyssi TaxID=1662395 RepID=A0A2P8FIU7_9RHOB|nr:hemolysin type calcium-binding protein [Shimia abyssi]
MPEVRFFNGFDPIDINHQVDVPLIKNSFNDFNFSLSGPRAYSRAEINNSFFSGYYVELAGSFQYGIGSISGTINKITLFGPGNVKHYEITGLNIRNPLDYVFATAGAHPSLNRKVTTYFEGLGVDFSGSQGGGVGTEGDDVETGSSSINENWDLKGGDDIAFTFGGNDRVIGGPGDDNLDGGDGNDFLRGDAGDDYVRGGSGNDKLFAGPTDNGNDRFFGDDGRDVIGGGRGNDTLSGGQGNDTVFGGDGNDQIATSLSNTIDSDEAWAGTGNDTVFGSDGGDTLGGGSGNDSIYAFDGEDIIYGGAGNDTAGGADGNDTIFAGGGDDLINGGEGNDLIFNGAGTDTVSGGSGSDTIWGAGGDDQFTGGDDADTFAFVQNNGTDAITDFSFAELDLLNVLGLGLSSESEALAAMTDVDGNVHLSAGGTTVIIEGHTVADFTANSGWFDDTVF